MEKNIFEKVFIEEEKKTVRHYLETLTALLEEGDYSGVETYAGYLLRSATRLNAYDGVAEVSFPGEE